MNINSQIRHLDLNLLRVFSAVLEEGSVSNAGNTLGITPSAVSHALNRLRYLLGDDLFVRTPEGMRPTARAAELGPSIVELLQQLHLALMPKDFAPGETSRTFTVSASPYVSSVLITRVCERLQREAPNAMLACRWNDGDIVQEMDAGRIDLAIGDFGSIPGHFDRSILFSDQICWAVNARLAGDRTHLTLEDLATFPHVAAMSVAEQDHAVDGFATRRGLVRSVALTDQGILDSMLAARGLKRRIAVVTAGALGQIDVVRKCDMVAMVPSQLAWPARNDIDVRFFASPYDPPVSRIAMLWLKQREHDPAILWLRQLLMQTAADMPGRWLA